MRWAEDAPPSARNKTPIRVARSRTGFDTLLEQLGDPAIIERLLSGGVIGDDLPRVLRQADGRRILVLAAHQDDELIGAGGTLLLAADARAAFEVIYYTDGSSNVAGMDPGEVSRVREDEAHEVWRRLAGVVPVFWRYPNRAERLEDDAPARLAEAIERFRPDTIFVPNVLEQPLEHRRMSELLVRAHHLRPLGSDIEVWGYQITTRLPGTVAVDITPVWKRKRALNALWASQNAYLDYAHLAMGRDMANAYYLKGRKYPRRAAAHAELFVAFPAGEYVELAERVLMPPSYPRRPKPPAPDFLVIGLQKSGTYWVTALLDAHPAIRCFPSRPGHADGVGEAHFFDVLALVQTDFPRFRKLMSAKLGGYFATAVPAAPPASDAERQLLVRKLRRRFNEFCALQRRRAAKRLVGEKTTETVHHPELVEELYPRIRKICIVRDPRDRLVSFLFHQRRKGRLEDGASFSDAFVRQYVERVRRDYEGLLRMRAPVHVLTYEQLSAATGDEARRLFDFLEVEADDLTVGAAVNASAFEALSGRARGEPDQSSHFRSGIAGGWRQHLPQPYAVDMVRELEGVTREVEARFGLDLSAYRTCDVPPVSDSPGQA